MVYSAEAFGAGGLLGEKLMSVKRARQRFADRDKGSDTFAPERKGMDMGMLGGILMMGAAAAWFFIGLAVGIFFPYPLVLFVIGIYAFLKGLVTGNIAGKRRAPVRRRKMASAEIDAPDSAPNADDPRFAGEGGTTEPDR